MTRPAITPAQAREARDLAWHRYANTCHASPLVGRARYRAEIARIEELERTYDEMAANARLFAAAPELLEALVFLANVARSTPGFPSPLALETADAAIAEARGAA